MKDLGKLFRFVLPYRRTAVFSLVTLFAMVALDLAIPRLVAMIIDIGIKRQDLDSVMTTSALMLGASLLSAAAAVLNNNSSIQVGEGVARDLRTTLFDKIQSLSWSDLDRFATGRLMVNLASDTGAVQRVFQVSLRIGTRAPLTMMGGIGLMFATSPSLAAAMTPILVVCGLVIWRFSATMEPLFRRVQERLDALNTTLQENIAGARLVKAFVRSDREIGRFGAANDAFADGMAKTMRYQAAMSPILTFLVNVGMIVVVAYGGVQVSGGKLSLGQIVAFTNYLIATLHPLVMTTQLANTWANGQASALRINQVLETRPAVADAVVADPVDAAPDTLPPGAMNTAVATSDTPVGEVRLCGVGFRYSGESDRGVLENIDLLIQAGRTTAILGATGSGKSSLANLIPRFYDPTEGSVMIDGIDVRRLRREDLRRRIGIVPQEAILFSGSILDNIRYGRPDATEAEAVAAASAAQADGFIRRSGDGYASRVEERGANLSGGQRQRLAIARALVARPDILILDDSTSAVDTETETAIHEALADFVRGRTLILIAQRVSTVLNADTIVVLEEGRIAAQGGHAELLRTSPVYREIYDSQLGGSRGL